MSELDRIVLGLLVIAAVVAIVAAGEIERAGGEACAQRTGVYIEGRCLDVRAL